MPTFIRKDGRYFACYITGPSHILLGLAFGSSPTIPRLRQEPAQGSCKHGMLDEARISGAVLEGVSEANVKIYPVEIIYVANDSPRYDLYKYCAYLIAKRVADGEPFADVSQSVS